MYTQGMENKQWREVSPTLSPPRKTSPPPRKPQRGVGPSVGALFVVPKAGRASRGCGVWSLKVEQAVPVLRELWLEGRRDVTVDLCNLNEGRFV